MPLKKIGRAIKKTVRKIVPKEVSGIMQVAAPFVAPFSLPGALALSIGGQLRQGQGRISPFKTLLAVAPSEQFRGFTRGLPGGQAFDEFLYGAPATGSYTSMAGGELRTLPGTDATQGILGIGGEFGPKQFLKGKLLSPDKTLSKSRIAGLVAAGASLATTQEEIKEEGDQLGLSDTEIAQLQADAADMWKDFDTTAFKPKVAQGGLMRINYAKGSDDDELKPDPTAPVNPFKPKPIGPVLPDKKGIKGLRAGPSSFFKRVEYLEYLGYSPEEASIIAADDDAYFEIVGYPMAQGGLMRTNFALGTKPTKQESGLGGLPIEADMRYTGGFMPYGAKEKADDVPARLSKNEFVFTADAVRAAGGGDVNTGARRMYNTMKQLESMGRA